MATQHFHHHIIEMVYIVRSLPGSHHTSTYKPVRPVPAWVEKPVSPVRQSSSGRATNKPPFPKMPKGIVRESRLLKLASVSEYSAAGGEQEQLIIDLYWLLFVAVML